MSNGGKGTLYTWTGNFRAYKGQIAAAYSGAQVTVQTDFKMNETNLSPEFVGKFPTTKVPAYENDEGVHLFECNAIAHYLANDQLRGKNPADQAAILQWAEFGAREINPVSATLVYPAMGIMQFNKQNHERAKDELKNLLRILNDHLRTRTYLVGERITLADIDLACDLLLLFQWTIEPHQRETYSNVTRWWLTLINQKEFQTVLGSDKIKLCQTMAQFDADKYAQISQSHKGELPQSQPRPHNPSSSTTTTSASSHNGNTEDQGATGDQKKGGGGKEKEKKKKETVTAAVASPSPDLAESSPGEKKKEPKKKAAATKEEEHEDEMEEEDPLTMEPKTKDPFADMPKANMNMDEFKRVYSNEDTATKAIPYFWNHFDNSTMSIWFCEYKYPEELTQVFMTCNLIGGMFQRLDKLRKSAFGSMCVFGENNDNTIAGVWFWRGQELAFELSPDWKTDYDSYNWERLHIDGEKTKALINQYLIWEGSHKGKHFKEGKIFK